MMQVPTNYKMGSGLAGAIMGQQTALEQEKMGLENLYKGMEMPGNILKGEEQAMLLQNPEYLKQKVQNTMIDLGNQYDAGQFQQSLNEFGRVKIQLQAATGNPQKQQQIVVEGLNKLGVPLESEFGRYALQYPDKAIDQLIQGTEAAGARAGLKYPGEMAKQTATDAAHMARTEKEIAGRKEAAQIGANATLGAAKYGVDKTNQTIAGGLAKNYLDEASKMEELVTKLTPSPTGKLLFEQLKKSSPEFANMSIEDSAKVLKKRADDYRAEAQRYERIALGQPGVSAQPSAGSTPNPNRRPLSAFGTKP